MFRAIIKTLPTSGIKSLVLQASSSSCLPSSLQRAFSPGTHYATNLKFGCAVLGAANLSACKSKQVMGQTEHLPPNYAKLDTALRSIGYSFEM
jgi:hypothetical protein